MTGSGASGMSSRDYMPIDVGIKREEDRFRVQGSEFQVWRGDMSLDLIFDICYLLFAICYFRFDIWHSNSTVSPYGPVRGHHKNDK